MGKNTGSGTRLGAVKNRSQTFNDKTGQYIKRGADGKFMSSKDTPYKGVRKEDAAKQNLATKKTRSGSKPKGKGKVEANKKAPAKKGSAGSKTKGKTGR